MRPAVVRMPSQTSVVHDETFAPILYVMAYDDLDDAIDMNNAVPQGLSSAIFTTDMREAERFMAADGSDCGIANVNIGTSGRRSVARSAGRSRPAVAASPGRIPGRPTCAGRPTPSTTPPSCRSPRA